MLTAEAPRVRLALFAYGFRPFFLAAGAYAALVIAAWLWIYTTGSASPSAMPPHLWHGHEMLFGFINAAIAGFLLTAVPSWTGAKGFAGWPLVWLVLAWLAGRVAFALNGMLAMPLLGACELLFLPLLMLFVAPPLLRARNRNTPLLFVLLALWLVDAAFLRSIARGDAVAAQSALHAGINVVMLLVTVIGGRIVPAFTASALRARGVEAKLHARTWLERLVIGAMVLIVIVDIGAPSSLASAILAGVAALAHALRMAGWRTRYTRREPLVWVLHVGYAWLPLGLALKAVFLVSGASWAAVWLHALTIGVAATMILAVMTRAALGHTGRPLRPPPLAVLAYGLVTFAALVRVFGPLVVPPTALMWTVTVAALLFVAAFVSFLIAYAPILMRPRVDGRPG
jgi:uncharacterized protein involved in response to NO